jgi:hypothetical protein
MAVSLAEMQAITEIARFVYDFLPGTPLGDVSVSFPGAAHEVGLGDLWQGGSKQPAIRSLLEATLTGRRDRFCSLMVAIVRKGIAYRSKKANPLTRDEVSQLNRLIERVGFRIPELWDTSFLDSLPHPQTDQPQQARVCPNTGELRSQLTILMGMIPQARGLAFERFLNSMFSAFALRPRGSFTLRGEQIDGSFELDHEIYLLEAKWENRQTGHADLLLFKEKVEAKATWSRGLFVSYAGFTTEGQDAFSRGRATNLIGMSGQDLYFILDGKVPLPDALRQKTRAAAETGRFYVPVQEIVLSGD